MFELFFALFLAFSCPAHNHNTNNSHNDGTVTTQDDPPAEGDDGHIPPKPIKPPIQPNP